MLLIDKEKLVKHIEEAWDWNMLDEKSVILLRQTLIDIGNEKVIKAIPIEWLHKKLIDLMYDGKAKEETLHVFHGIIGDWEKQNESHNSN